MAQCSERLDEVFHALSDPTRRAVVRHLGAGPASVGELAEPFEMALTSFLKHIRVLEASGCIRTVKRGRVRECVLEPHTFAAVDGWLAEERAVWEARTDRLERVVLSETDDEREGGS